MSAKLIALGIWIANLAIIGTVIVLMGRVLIAN